MIDVAIAGAGPNGLMLACELRLAGIRVAVLEQAPGPLVEPKANGLLGQVVRLLDHRGLYEPLAGTPGPPTPNQGYFMFGAMPLDLSLLEASPVYALPVPQREVVAALAARAVELGAEIRYEHQLVGFDQGEGSVDLEVDGPEGRHRLQARYLVGADGAHSATRKLAGIGFPGVSYDRTTVRSAHVTLPPDMIDAASGALVVPGYGSVPPFLPVRTERGGFSYAPLPGHPPLISTVEWDEAAAEESMSLDELRASIRRVLAAELPFDPPPGEKPNVLRRLSGGNTRIAERFRDRRVFLIGDAAHVFGATAGGPGLNLGLVDAMNLGWKLAAAIGGDAGEELLDTYEGERRPAAERMSMNAAAQAALIAPGSDVTSLRELFAELLRDPGTVGRLAELIAGSDVRYEMGIESPDPLVGRAAPDLVVHGEDGTATPLAQLTREARPVLVDQSEDGSLAAALSGWGDRLECVKGKPADRAPAVSLLLRPDCFVAWASTSATPTAAESEALRSAAARWLGASTAT